MYKNVFILIYINIQKLVKFIYLVYLFGLFIWFIYLVYSFVSSTFSTKTSLTISCDTSRVEITESSALG